MVDQEADQGQEAAQNMKLIWTDLILIIPALLVLILCLVVGYHGGREDAEKQSRPP